MLAIYKHIGFDYAIKRILREKANIGILKGRCLVTQKA